ncbi:hypothetical protein JJB99_01875 [Bradyrhizobium diazoefficiens]|uniref:hypothetical protein n=1 Tax=Bradyrhizobium diazoefficiens TaxID=1355477 RepID=UPI0019096A0A|nr:hypothetical protein [Bradyrhizobium diazoefficiens]QQO14965.1 hypothetical protein JJB99_01875 [Bradyrhizobium diazoefficiens]
MTDLFDNLVSPGADSDEADAAASGGSLIVPEHAPNGQFLLTEQQAFLAAGPTAYLVMFVETDEATQEPALANAREFANAMGLASPPDEHEAFACVTQRLGEAFEPWRERLAEAWAGAVSDSEFTAKPKSEDAPIVWTRPKHSTGRNRGQA